MRYLAMSAILAASLALPDRPAPVVPPKPKEDADLEKLQGAWEVIETNQNGRVQNVIGQRNLIIKGDRFGWSEPDDGTFKLDPTKTPKTIDYWLGSANDPSKAWQGIYELNGDTFRDCMAPPGQPRPTEFAVPPGSGRTMQTFRRVK
jgi:uncharacterized protein (TIGR03067 family)